MDYTTTKDHLAIDLLDIIEACQPLDGEKKIVTVDDLMMHVMDQNQLMQKLCSYIVRRDARVHNHAYRMGYQKGKEDAEN